METRFGAVAKRGIGMPKRKKPKLLIFVVAYNAEKTIETVLSRIPASLVDDYRVEVLIIDDSSPDATFEQAARFKDTMCSSTR